MTELNLQEKLQRLQDIFGEDLASPEHQPRIFEWQYRLMLFIESNQSKSVTVKEEPE